VRLGTPAMTTRGLGEAEMKQIANWMKRVADICAESQEESALDNYNEELATIRDEVRELALAFPVPGI